MLIGPGQRAETMETRTGLKAAKVQLNARMPGRPTPAMLGRAEHLINCKKHQSAFAVELDTRGYPRSTWAGRTLLLRRNRLL